MIIFLQGWMCRRTLIILPLTLTAISCLMATRWQAKAIAQQTASEQRLSDGGKVTVRNRSGRITVTGWDRDTVQATATSTDRAEAVSVRIIEAASPTGALLITPETKSGKVHLEVKLPRHAGVELVSSSGDVEATDLSGPLAVDSGSGSVNVNRVDSLEVRARSGDLVVNNVGGRATLAIGSGDILARRIKGDLTAKVRSGDVRVEDLGGMLNIALTSGELSAQNVGGDVRVVSINGDITVECVKGRVDANTTSGSIILTGIDGDVAANTTSKDIIWTGTLRPGGRYHMKSLSGEVRMVIPADAPSFTATLASYSGEIETDFPLKLETPFQRGSVGRRIIGRYSAGRDIGRADERAQITLESFSKAVVLSRAAKVAAKNCRR